MHFTVFCHILNYAVLPAFSAAFKASITCTCNKKQSLNLQHSIEQFTIGNQANTFQKEKKLDFKEKLYRRYNIKHLLRMLGP